MNTSILFIGLIVGTVNFLFRYLPLRLGASRVSSGLQHGKTGLLLDSIGIASICALLVVSSVPDMLKQSEKVLPALAGFTILTLCFYTTRSIIIATLAGALCYGIAFKFFITMI
ncbi:L-valine transporter subunit YgaH [Pectobacteriaceae bacterium CE90]|nr:L-valine transporter subunit YgaH [Pectobacteriaceae bacterium CE90]